MHFRNLIGGAFPFKGELAFRFNMKRAPDGRGDHFGVVDRHVGPALELALEGASRAALLHELVEAREPARVAFSRCT